MGLRVTITGGAETSGGNGPSVVLVDSPDPLPVFNIRINGRPVTQVVQAMRASYIKIFDRKLRQFNMSFSGRRNKDRNGQEFSGIAQATAFAMDRCGIISACPHYGLIRFDMSDENASLTRWIRGGALTSIDCGSIHGIGLDFTYAILGGELLTTNPVTQGF